MDSETAPENASVGWRWDLAVFLASVGLIAVQIVWMQGLSQAQGHHFAYLVISLAMLGFGSSGAILALIRNWALQHASWLLPVLLLGTGLAAAFGLGWSQQGAAAADFHTILVESRPWYFILGSALGAFLPFLLGALFLGLVFTRDVESVGRRYAANLLGSAGGAGLGLAILLWTPPERAIPLLALLPWFAAFLVIPPGAYKKRIPLAAIAVVCALILFAGWWHREAPMSQYKALQQNLRLPDAQITLDAPHPMGRLQLVESPAMRYGPGLSLRFRGEIPVASFLHRDGDGYGAVLPPSEDAEAVFAESVTALPLSLGSPQSALVLHAGGGALAGFLLTQEIPEVTIVEPHPIAANLLVATYSGPDHSPRVIRSHGRAYLNRPTRAYDLVVIPPQGAFGGGIGLQSLQEDYLLTVESFQRMFRALDKEGFLAVSLYLDQPPRATLKMLGLFHEALLAEGIADPSQHLAAVRSWEMMTMVASPSPLHEIHRTWLAEFSRRHGFDRAWIPGIGVPLEDQQHRLPDDLLAEGFTAILTGNGATFTGDYPFRIAAPRDQKPYFQQFVRFSRLDEVRRVFGEGSLAYVEMGSLIVAITAGLLGVAVVIFIVTPLLFLRAKRTGAAPVFLYFASLGLGFMFLEITWIQRFTLLWGSPLHAAAGVIVALLCGMGVGSLWSNRCPCAPHLLRRMLGVVVGIVAATLLLYPWFFELALSWPEWLQWGIGMLLIAIPAVFMGWAFPSGLRAVGRSYPAQVPWAWGINGCFSVLAAPIAVLLALGGGFPVVGIAAALAYLTAWWIAPKLW